MTSPRQFSGGAKPPKCNVAGPTIRSANQPNPELVTSHRRQRNVTGFVAYDTASFTDFRILVSMAPQVYAAIQPPSEEGEKPVTVLVTGFGPFLSKYPQNSSWTIASTLPALLPATPQNPTPIHIHTHHAPIRVSYNTVLDLIPTLLPPGNPMYPVPDIILHIGLAAGRSYYAIESTARGRGYGQIADVDGIRFSDEEAEERFPGNMYPRTLETGFEMGDVLGRWKGFLGGLSRAERKTMGTRKRSVLLM
ncbi:hypothetical protein CFE70_005412 [Pyrenophora teres f. teres 0-1]